MSWQLIFIIGTGLLALALTASALWEHREDILSALVGPDDHV